MKDSDQIKKAQEVLKELLELLGVEAEAQIAVKIGEDERKFLEITVNGENLGYLIGYRGKTLSALQTVFMQIMYRGSEESLPVVIDINNYRQRRNEYLISLAERAAVEARESKQNIELPPLSGFERRIVHLALKNEQDIVTESTGMGADRHIVVKFTSK